jgi:23S rRNA (cytosine1962-C5)-methyltransferase
MTQVKLKKGEGRTVNAGGLWIYDNEIDEILPEGGQMPEPGDPVRVLAFNEYPLGVGFYNPASKIRIRLLSRDADADITSREFYAKRVHDAVEYRRHILEDLDSCRLIFGEADYLPGLTVDKFSDTLVLQSLWLGTDRYKEMIADLLKAELAALGIPIRGVYERSDAKVRLQEGLELRTGFIGEPFDTLVTIVENGVKYHVDVAEGQKTGFFLDQKFNRRAIRPMCRDAARVLDVFTHTGSFALNAAMAGARDVTAVDASAPAIEMARENAKLNGVEDRMHFECGDAFAILEQKVEAGERYDVVILDPPAFTKSRASVKNATRGYREINLLGLQLVQDGGYFATCSCSHFMTPELLEAAIAQAARAAHKRLRQIEVRAQSPDHPVVWGMENSYYLKFYIFQVSEER